MSTIASPREAPSTPVPRRMHSSNQTPSSSSRTSLDGGVGVGGPNHPRSATSSPNPSSSSSAPTIAVPTPPAGAASSAAAKRNRAALREFYNLKKNNTGGTPEIEIETDATRGADHHLHAGYSEVPPSEMDAANFDAAAFVARAAAESSLADLLRTYARVLGETRALDAEKKALVYDNYSKLIAATETIRKMRANMDPLNPMASTLDPAIAQIYSQASSMREALRREVLPPEELAERRRGAEKRERTRQLAVKVLATPERLRRLVGEGKVEEAEREWELPRRLLLAWKEKGLGGEDVRACLEEGDAALRGSREGEEGEGEGEGEGGS